MNFPANVQRRFAQARGLRTVLRGILTGMGDPRAFLERENGDSLVELALIFSLFAMPFLITASEVGRLVYQSIEVSNAANTAASYGMQSSTLASDSSGITTAARADAADFGVSLAVTPTTFYVCASNVGGTQYTGANAQSNAAAACSRPLEFLSVVTSATVTPSVHFPGLPSSFQLKGASVQEVME